MAFPRRCRVGCNFAEGWRLPRRLSVLPEYNRKQDKGTTLAGGFNVTPKSHILLSRRALPWTRAVGTLQGLRHRLSEDSSLSRVCSP